MCLCASRFHFFRLLSTSCRPGFSPQLGRARRHVLKKHNWNQKTLQVSIRDGSTARKRRWTAAGTTTPGGLESVSSWGVLRPRNIQGDASHILVTNDDSRGNGRINQWQRPRVIVAWRYVWYFKCSIAAYWSLYRKAVSRSE